MKCQVSLFSWTWSHLQRIEHHLGRQSAYKLLITELRVFRSDLEFSTMTKFLPGLIRAAFQNSVPKSIPKT